MGESMMDMHRIAEAFNAEQKARKEAAAAEATKAAKINQYREIDLSESQPLGASEGELELDTNYTYKTPSKPRPSSNPNFKRAA